MARSALACVKRIVLAIGGKTTRGGKHQESKPGDLQPELVGDVGKVLQGGARAAHYRAEDPAVFYVLASYAGGYAQFAARGNVCHSSRF